MDRLNGEWAKGERELLMLRVIADRIPPEHLPKPGKTAVVQAGRGS
jgi:hypothetical protein